MGLVAGVLVRFLLVRSRFGGVLGGAGKKMTISMSVQEQIRRLDAEGVPARQIARDLGVSRDSVAKYVAERDFSPRPVVVHRRPGGSVFAKHAATVDGWLADDEKRPRKQRHTAQRIFDRLVAECGYQGSYSPVQRHVKAAKAAKRSAGQEFSELVWAPGVAQVDFGQAKASIAGVMATLHVLFVTFPFSNMRFAQAFFGETAECVCQGLRTIFEHAGGVPRELIFDNATSAGRRSGEVIIESGLFAAFKLHYRTSARYCNPYSGHEKGNVENAVGFLRRNLMVPEPRAASLDEFNRLLLARCDELGSKDHWRKTVPIAELFARDQATLLALPGIGFDAVRFEARRADKTGNIVVDGNTYAAGPAMGGYRLTVGLRHDRVEILDEAGAPVVVLPRVFGQQTATVFDPALLLPLLVRKPGTWGNSPVRDTVPPPVCAWLDQARSTDRRDMLAAIHHAAKPAGLVNALAAAEIVIAGNQRPDTAAIGMLARRLAAGVEPATGIADLSVYDELVGNTGQVSA